MSSDQSITWASRQRPPTGASCRSQRKTSQVVDVGAVLVRRRRAPRPSATGTWQVASSAALVRLSPTLRSPSAGPAKAFASSLREHAQASARCPRTHRTAGRPRRSACSPLCPNGGWPRSWASPATSTTSGSQPSTRPSSRPICATSRECVSRVRGKSREPSRDDLRLAGEAAEGGAVQDACAVALELRSGCALVRLDDVTLGGVVGVGGGRHQLTHSGNLQGTSDAPRAPVRLFRPGGWRLR